MKIKTVVSVCFGGVMLLYYLAFIDVKSAPRVSDQSITTIKPLAVIHSSTRREAIHVAPTSTTPPTAVPIKFSQPPVQFDPTAIPTATPEPPLEGYAPEMAGVFITQTVRFDVYRGKNTFDQATLAAMLPYIEAGIVHAERLLGTKLQQRTSMGFYAYGTSQIKGIRGLAASDERRLRVYYSAGESRDGAISVAIHEAAHQLEFDRYGAEAQRLADTILHEGLATWLSDEAWLSRTDSQTWRERGQALLQSGQLLPIRRDPGGVLADTAYEGWASFVDFLITKYGWHAFDYLYCSGQGRWAGSAQYKLVYGKSLNELVDEWHEWLINSKQ